MTAEKQIEEMDDIAEILCDHYDMGTCICNHEVCDLNCPIGRKVEKLYDEGYRKQSEGKWIWINQAKSYLEPHYGDTCKCSLCEFEIDVSETHYKYCPECGAQMKGCDR